MGLSELINRVEAAKLIQDATERRVELPAAFAAACVSTHYQ